MTPVHKPGPGPGSKNGLVLLGNGLSPSRSSHPKRKVPMMIFKFALGLLIGLFLTRFTQNLLFVTSNCVHSIKIVPPGAPHPISVVETVKNSSSTLQEESVRQLLIIGVMTANKYIETRARAVYETWGQRVPGKILFFTAEKQDNNYEELPVVHLKGVDDSYPPQKKSFLMLKYLYENYGNKFEWFMRADDDVFVKTDQLELFLRNINSSNPFFIGQAGKGIQEEFGLLSLEYDENFCMGGPGIIFSHVTLARVAPHVKDCLKNLYTTHEDVELGRCVQKYAGIPCTWSYEMQNIFYHNSSGRLAFTGPLKSREVHRAITLHPIKEYAHMYRVHNYIQGLAIQNKVFSGLKMRREMAASISQLRKRLGPMWNPERVPVADLETLGLAPTLNKFLPSDENQLLVWNFLARAVYAVDSVNPRRRIDSPLREGIEDVIREVMEGINTLSKERGRIIDFKELLYGYYRVNPRFGVDYILDILLVYKKYRGRKMTFPVRRHAYLQQPFGPLMLRQSSSTPNAGKTIHFILPLAGRFPVFQRFLDSYERVCLQTGQNVQLIIVLFPTFTEDDPRRDIRSLVETCRQRIIGQSLSFDVEIIERQEKFARAAALETGAASCRRDDCLLVFIDVDMVFNVETLHRIRTHTIQHKQVYFPIVFSQFDPTFGGNVSSWAPLSVAHPKLFEIDEDKGYWRFYGFGIASLYRSDLQRVGGFNVSIRGWGQEDVDLFDRIVRTNLTVFRAPDPGFIHVYHAVNCDTNLEAKQYEMCLGTRANTFASQRQLAQYWIDHHRSD